MPRASLLCASLCVALASVSAQAATYVVNVGGDPGGGLPAGSYSLRTAIAAANASAGTDTIAFALGAPGSAQTIALLAPLPTVTQPVFFDGWSQGGASYKGAPLVSIDGTLVPASFGLNIQAPGVTVRGLRIVNFPALSGNGFGMGVFGGGRAWIYGCVLAGNGQGAVWIADTAGSLVGTNADGTDDAAERNVIYGNAAVGIYLTASGTTVAGNFVGLQADGATPGAQAFGIYDQGGGNQIGGRGPAARNVVAASSTFGIYARAGSGTVVEGNVVGLAADGVTAVPNGTGIYVEGSGVRIGTDADGLGDAAERNVVSGNTGAGIALHSSSNLVAGNYVGLSTDGLLDRGNGGNGIELSGPSNQVGGPLPAQRNVISGNGGSGLRVAASDSVIQGNYVGLAASGTAVVANNGGLSILAGDRTLVGGSTPGTGNVISGNEWWGVEIAGGRAHVVRGNLIGVASDGVTPAGNTGTSVYGLGVLVSTSSDNLIGGAGEGDGNVIAYNASRGVVVQGVATGVALLRNRIFSNSSVGIDLAFNGVTPNDPGDADTGPNNLQNFPTLAYAASGGGSLTVQGTLDSLAGNYRLEFFASPALDPTSHGEGQLFVGAATVASGTPFTLAFPAAVPATWFLTATATDTAGNTSEFSKGITLQPTANLRLTMGDSPDPVPPATPLVYTLTAQNLGPSLATGVRVVDALPAGVSFVKTTGCVEDPVGLPQCTLGSIPAGGSQSFTIEVSVQPAPPPSAMNVAVVAGNEPDPVGSNNSDSVTTWLMPTADVLVDVTDGSATVLAGGQTTYTVEAQNLGPSAITGARVQDAFPAGLTCAWTCAGSLGGVCTAAGSGDIDETVDLPVSASLTFTAVCQVASSVTGTVVDTATVSLPAGSHDPVPGNNAATDADTVVAEADLEITQTDTPDPAPVFGQVTYTLQVANLGPSDAAGLTVTDTLPPGTSFVSSIPPAPTCTPAGGSLACALGPLAAGATLDVTVVVAADPGTIGPIGNAAAVLGADPDPNSANDTSSEGTTVAFRKGDLDNDLQTDLLFRHLPDGQHAAWLMNGVAQRSVAAVSPDPDTMDWQVVGIDDFDGDHRNDLVLWNAGTGQVEFWLMNGPSGTTREGAPVALTGAAPLALNWRLAATADFDLDGHPDLVWRNQASQNIVIWTLGQGAAPGTQKTGAIIPVPAQAVDANWEIVGARDFDGDGATDLLWYNSTSGKIVEWLMDTNVQRLTGRFTVPPNAGDANWKVLAAGDFGVGAAGVAGSNDVVWRNASSGKLVVWYLDLAGNRTAGTFTVPDGPPAPATDWTVAGPR